MKFYTRPQQRAFPRTRQQLKWSRFKRAMWRFIESQWFTGAILLLLVCFAIGYVSVY